MIDTDMLRSILIALKKRTDLDSDLANAQYFQGKQDAYDDILDRIEKLERASDENHNQLLEQHKALQEAYIKLGGCGVVDGKVIESKMDNTKKIEQWIITGSVGTSSKTLWAAMMGIEPCDDMGVDIPYDPDDFSRCYELMKLATPEQIKMGLNRVVVLCPKWIPFAREWDKLVDLYEEEHTTGSCPKLYELMKELEKEAYAI